jgi:NAD(P)H-hydrate repair Nnr-like enzyme with NAD(P)H-hydrate epimerase domain
MLLMTLSRVHNNAGDTYAADARLIEFDIHYQVISPGSRQEFVK